MKGQQINFRNFAIPYILAPRVRALSYSSKNNTPEPSPITKPSRSTSKGREASFGESFFPHESAFARQKPAKITGLII